MSMQEKNIRNYKKLELESETIAKKIESLTKIEDVFTEWKENEDAILTQKYIYHRSDLQIKSKKFRKR